MNVIVILSYGPKDILTWMLREAKGGLKATVGNRITTRLSLYHIVFCCFLFLSAKVLFSLAGYAQKPAHIVHCGPKSS